MGKIWWSLAIQGEVGQIAKQCIRGRRSKEK